MNQVIKFKRGSSTYTSYESAITALNGVTHKVGQPIIVYYKESSEATDVKILLAIGKSEGVGEDKYRLFNPDVQSDWLENDPDSSSYIQNKPTINNASFTVKSKIGSSSAVDLSEFTANQSTDNDLTFIQGDNVKFTNDTTNRTLTIGADSSSFYGTCSTATATDAKTSTITGYVLKTGVTLQLKFTNAVNAGATLNINNGTGETKSIYYNGSAIIGGIIKAGDIATFTYDGTYYQLLSVNTCSITYIDSTVLTKSTVAAALLS